MKLELNIIHHGNCLDLLRQMADESVNCVITSPPYWGLRDYGLEPVVWDGAWRGSLGLEPTFELYIEHLIQIFNEIKRVLRKDGTCWVNLGDTYGGSGGYGDITGFDKSATGFHQRNDGQKKQAGRVIAPKCLLQIPSRFAIAMTDAGWILRNTIIWHKRNCMPSSAKDRFTVDYEVIHFFTKSKKYWFEQQKEQNVGTAGNRKVFRGYGDYTTQGNSNAFNGKERGTSQLKASYTV